jgi:hypothetical protein
MFSPLRVSMFPLLRLLDEEKDIKGTGPRDTDLNILTKMVGSRFC